MGDTVTPDDQNAWRETFLATLASSPNGTGRGNVAAACREAGISRKTAYQHRKTDDAFANQWEDAAEEAKAHCLESIQRTAVAWATTGVPVDETTEVFDAAGKLMSRRTVRRYHRSPTVAIFMLKKLDPATYGDVLRVEQSGTIELSVTGEEADAAVGTFDATVVRLADARRARDGDQRSATG